MYHVSTFGTCIYIRNESSTYSVHLSTLSVHRQTSTVGQRNTFGVAVTASDCGHPNAMRKYPNWISSIIQYHSQLCHLRWLVPKAQSSLCQKQFWPGGLVTDLKETKEKQNRCQIGSILILSIGLPATIYLRSLQQET